MELPSIETVAAQLHERWVAANRIKGIYSSKSSSGEEMMVPYAQLSEDGKRMSRELVERVYSALQAATGAPGGHDPAPLPPPRRSIPRYPDRS